MITSARRVLPTIIAATVGLCACMDIGVAQAEPPVKLLVESQYGAKVNLDETGFCVKSACNPAGAIVSAIPGGFAEAKPTGVAVNDDPASPGHGNIFVADSNRVQELTPAGVFVLMLGRDVNETTGGDICTEAEIVKAGVKCKAGVSGTAPGEFNGPRSLAVDPVNATLSVEDIKNNRIQEFTETGAFVLTIGKEVNATKDGAAGATAAEKNLCTATSGNVCQAGVRAAGGSTEHGAFTMPGGGNPGSDLAAGGPDDLLYVDDENGVQEFKPDGAWVADLPLPARNHEAIALDQTNGELYLTRGEGSPAILRFDATGKQIGEFVLKPREPGAPLEIEDIALDSSGRIAVTELEIVPGKNGGIGSNSWFGSLLQAGTGKPLTQLTVLPRSSGDTNGMQSIAFNAGTLGAGEEMYGATAPRQEVVGYVPTVVGETVTGASSCNEEGEQETSIAFQCELAGQVNPENVAETEAWFSWSNTKEALNGPEISQTAHHSITTGNAPVPVTGVVAGQRPNESLHYELASFDAFVQAPEPPLAGEVTTIFTPLVAPKIVGEPNAQFVKSFSAVLFGELNPENARTEYFFEYGPGEALNDCPGGVDNESCPGVAKTATLQSAVYGKIATTLEATGLQPATLYHYRLSAESENTAKNLRRSSLETPDPEAEGSFTTAPAPAPLAQTGGAVVTGATSATVTGSVDPAGQPAVYRFELGVENGPSTQYGTVFSGSVEAGDAPTEERLALTGLQPGTTYVYRIAVQSGYGTAYGAGATFTTTGLPSILVPPTTLAQLPVPDIAFPVTPVPVKPKQQKAKGKQVKHGKAKGRKPKSKKAKGKKVKGKKANGSIVAVTVNRPRQRQAP